MSKIKTRAGTVIETTQRFALIGGRIINVSEVKWAGIPVEYQNDGTNRVQIEFISGGWCLLPEGVTAEGVLSLLNGDPF
jgi:hypothetical protein